MSQAKLGFKERFPFGTDTIKFAKPRSPLASWNVGELHLETYPPYEFVEIPREVVESIYASGWHDAMAAAVSLLKVQG